MLKRKNKEKEELENENSKAKKQNPHQITVFQDRIFITPKQNQSDEEDDI